MRRFTVRVRMLAPIHTMKTLARICYGAAYASIPVSIAAYVQQSQYLGIFIGLWVPTLLISGMLAAERAETGDHEL